MAVSQLLLRAPDILRAAGCTVVEYPGWRTRGRPWAFEPRGAVLHHDGSPVGPAKPPEVYARFLFEVGRPSEDIPAPLCQFWIDFYGAWWIGAAGGANHALGATGWGAFPPGDANRYGFGVEMDNTTDEPTTPDQYEALHRGLPALFREFGWDPADALAAHKEVDYPRKSDPDDIDMPQMRSDVRYLMQHPLGGDWYDMADEDDLKNAMRAVLNEGTGDGQTSWAGTSKATLGTAQRLVNDVAALSDKVGPTWSVVKLTDHPAQWLISGGVRVWIKDLEDLEQLGLETDDYETVKPDDTRWSYPAVGEIPADFPQVPYTP